MKSDNKEKSGKGFPAKYFTIVEMHGALLAAIGEGKIHKDIGEWFEEIIFKLDELKESTDREIEERIKEHQELEEKFVNHRHDLTKLYSGPPE